MSLCENSFTKTLNLKYPLVVAPMAGGPSSVELVTASCRTGALGSIGAAYMTATAISEMTKEVREKTDRPFQINLFIPSRIPRISEDRLLSAIQKTQKFRDEFALPPPKLEPPYEDNFDQQFEAVLAVRPAVFSFIFGVLEAEYIKAARDRGIYLVGTATSSEEALALDDAGVDAIVLQGLEAGGHRGIFDPVAEDPQITALELLARVRTKTRRLLIAAGGIMTSTDVKTMLQAGADAVQMGTAFLAVKEAGTSAPYRQKLLKSNTRTTRTTRAFSGRLARGIENRFMNEMDVEPGAILPFPAQNKFTRDLRNASAQAGSAEFLSLWCGGGQGPLSTGSVASLIESLFADLDL